MTDTPLAGGMRATAWCVPHDWAMLLLSAGGMAVGLAIDCGTTPPELIAALCTSAAGSFAATLRFHLTVMPASYALAAIGGLVGLAASRNTAPLRLAGGAAEVFLMLAGMAAGGWLAPEVAAALGIAPRFGVLVAAMAGGMVLAAAAGAAIAGVRDRAKRADPAQYIMYQ